MRRALFINAVFSSLSGVALVIFHRQIALVFGLETITPFLVIGIALIFFSLSIIYEIKRQNRMGIMWIITQDILWVLGSIYMLFVNPFSISPTGNITIAVVGSVVLIMAINQAVALSKQQTEK